MEELIVDLLVLLPVVNLGDVVLSTTAAARPKI
jgi:hypothetical protein